MKLPKWIKRGPKSNVGVKSIVKSSGGSDGAAGGGTVGGNSQRHRRKSSSASLKGKRKRNSYVSSAITTKNFYPAEHFFKNGPPPSGNVDAGDGEEALMMARFRTLPASFGAGYYQQPGSAYHQGPQQAQQYQHQRPHPLGLPNGDGVHRNTVAARGGYNGGGERLYRETLAPNGMQSGVQQQAFFPPQQSMTLDRRYFAPSIGHHADPYRTVPTDNGFVSKSPYHPGHTLPPHNSTLQQQKQQSNATGYELGVPTDRVRQILPTSATGLYSGQQQQHQQQQHPHQRGLRGSFRRYKIPSPAEIFEMINDKYIHPVGAGKKKASKVERTSWDYSTVTLSRVPGYGFGIAVSGGRDNPHFANGDPSIAVSDVLKNGPAEGQLQVNDRILSVNGVSLENVEYATAVQVLRDSGNTVTLVVRRRVPNHSMMHPLSGTNMHSMPGIPGGGGGGAGGGGGPLNGPVGVGGVGSGGMAPTGVPGMNSHQHQHSLSSTGLVGLGANNGSQQQIKVIVTKANKKDDFGIVLGCRLFIREISSKTKDQLAANGYSLQEGDLVTRIHNTNCNDAMSLKEAKKIIDGCKERLTLAVLREPNGLGGAGAGIAGYGPGAAGGSGMQSPVYSHTAQVSNCSNMDENYLNGTGGSYSGQNLYVQPPTRPSAMSTLLADDKSNLTPRGRSRGPLTDISLQQLDRPSTPPGTSSRSTADGAAAGGAGGHSRSRSAVDEPPRPPPPRGEDFYATRRQLLDEKPPTSEPRYITFQKEGSVGIRLTGGNEVGIFVTAVQQNSPASAQGLVPGDKILKVNDMDMNGVTREEAVLFLLSLQDRIDLIVQYCKEEFDNITAQQRGDSFHIKTHFHCDAPTKGELTFKAGDVFRVIDTLYNGVVGAWQVLRIGRGHQELQRGVIPNKARAEELATVQFNASKKDQNASESRVSFFRRRRSTHRRSKSLSRENWDDVVFSDAISKFPAYERVVLRHPGFVRPVVIFGPVADIARERLMKDFPDKYTAPLQDDDKGSSKCGGIVRLSNIRDIMDRGKHALLDVTPNAVDRLNYAQFYPIVIFLKADTKHTIKQMRQGLPKAAHKSSKKLFEQCQKLERVWSHVFSTTINLNDPDTWYRKLRDSIDQQQSGAVWMSETKRVELSSDIFLPYLPPPCPLSCCNYVSPLPPPPKPYASVNSRTPYRYSMPAASLTAGSFPSHHQQAPFNHPLATRAGNVCQSNQSQPLARFRPATALGTDAGMIQTPTTTTTTSPRPITYYAPPGLRHSNPNVRRSTVSLQASSSYGGKSSTATTTGTSSSEQLLYEDELPPPVVAGGPNRQTNTTTAHATPYFHNPPQHQRESVGNDRARSYTNILAPSHTLTTFTGPIANGNCCESECRGNGDGGHSILLHDTNHTLTTPIDVNGNRVHEHDPQFIAYIDN